MEPGTKFCPDHRGLKVPPFADYCSVCNRRLETVPGGKVAEKIIIDEVRPFKEFREKIEAKIEEKKAAKAPEPFEQLKTIKAKDRREIEKKGAKK